MHLFCKQCYKKLKNRQFCYPKIFYIYKGNYEYFGKGTMGEEQIKAVAASAYMPINAINPIMNYNNPEQAKIRAAQEFSRAFTARIHANIDGYNERMAQFGQYLAKLEKEYSQDQIQKRYSEIASLGLESTTDPLQLKYGLGKLTSLFNFFNLNKTDKSVEDLIYGQKKLYNQTLARYEKIKTGQEAEAGQKIGGTSNPLIASINNKNHQNIAGTEFQNVGERDILG